MIHALRKLARAVHRRALWQVLAAHLLISWALWGFVAWATRVTGLPGWTPLLALVLLAAMLPLIVATAVVQGGLPGLAMEDEIDPNELVGRTPAEVLVVPEAHPLYGSGIFTWRNTALGAVSCAALLVTSVVAYMTMWAFGIGPVGSLLAQGVIVEQEPIVLAGFDNRTGDAALGAFVTEAFELDLSRSSVVTVADPELVRAAAVGMGMDSAAAITVDVARRVAQQEGVRLIVSGDIERRGAGYMLSSVISLSTGSVLARFQEACPGDDDLLPAIEALSERVRERTGESLRIIREGSRLAPITTDVVEAHRLYRDAGAASMSGDLAGAIDLLERAVVVDPAFVMAWRRLGMLSEESADPARARAAYQTVVDLWAPSGHAQRTVQQMTDRIAALD